MPLLSLQDALTLFLYFLQAAFMDTSSVSEQERQSLAAVSRSESAKFPLNKPESEDAWSLVLLELSTTAPLSGSASPPMGLKEGLDDSHLCCLEPVLVSGVKSGVCSLHHVELCSFPASTLGEVTQVLLA